MSIVVKVGINLKINDLKVTWCDLKAYCVYRRFVGYLKFQVRTKSNDNKIILVGRYTDKHRLSISTAKDGYIDMTNPKNVELYSKIFDRVLRQCHHIYKDDNYNFHAHDIVVSSKFSQKDPDDK